MDVEKLAEMIRHAVPYPPERYAEQLLEAIRRALGKRAPAECLLAEDMWGNRHDRLMYDGVAYACAIRVRAPDYSRRAILVPGAVIALIHDGPETYCHVYAVRTVEEALKILDVESASELHAWPEGVPPETWRFVCLR